MMEWGFAHRCWLLCVQVRDTRESTSEARRILQRMTRRVLTNNIFLYTVIAVLVGSICLVIYHDFIKPSKDFMF